MSKFVSKGTAETPSESDEAWLAAQRKIEESTVRKLNEGKQEGGKSLYEVLQANKEAKQEAFEESIKLKHQFRSLDEDDISFLDSITQKERDREAKAHRETNIQLQSFRALQEEAEQVGKLAELPTDSAPIENWSSGARKRKKEKEFAGIVKKRQTAVAADAAGEVVRETLVPADDAQSGKVNAPNTAVSDVPSLQETITEAARGTAHMAVSSKPDAASPPTQKPLLGLTDYSSDEDD